MTISLLVYDKEKDKEFIERVFMYCLERKGKLTTRTTGDMLKTIEITNNENQDRFYFITSEEALKYYGGHSFYLNRIYSTDNVDEKDMAKIRELFITCIRHDRTIADTFWSCNVEWEFKLEVDSHIRRERLV